MAGSAHTGMTGARLGARASEQELKTARRGPFFHTYGRMRAQTYRASNGTAFIRLALASGMAFNFPRGEYERRTNLTVRAAYPPCAGTFHSGSASPCNGG